MMVEQLMDDTNKRAVAFWSKVNDMQLAAAQNTVDPYRKSSVQRLHDPYMISTHLPYYGVMPTSGYYQPPTTISSTNQMHFGDPLQTKIDVAEKSTNKPSSHPYPKPKTKVYLSDGRRKLSKSKADRDRERMTKFIQKKSEARKAPTIVTGESGEEAENNGEIGTSTVE